MKTKRCRSRHSGLSAAEMVIAMAVAVSAMVCISQLMAVTARQNRALEQGAVAVREVGNVMEDLMSRPWDALTPGNPPSIELSQECRDLLPDVQLSVEISSKEEVSGAKRISLGIDWLATEKKRREPVRLVAWRTQEREEVQP